MLESGQDTRTICDFPSHMVSLHSSPGISCNTCGLSFYNKEGLCSHEQYQHTMPLLLHCNYCDQTFKEMRQLNIHVKNNHTPPPAPPREEPPQFMNSLMTSLVISSTTFLSLMVVVTLMLQMICLLLLLRTPLYQTLLQNSH